MHPRFVSLALHTFLALAVAGCGGGSSPSSPSNNPPAGGGGGGAANTIIIPAGDGYGSSSFSPTNLTVAPGASVTWSNRDTVAHTTTANGNAWNATIEAGSSFTRTFPDRGSFPYRCTVHAGMNGTITVQ